MHCDFNKSEPIERAEQAEIVEYTGCPNNYDRKVNAHNSGHFQPI